MDDVSKPQQTVAEYDTEQAIASLVTILAQLSPIIFASIWSITHTANQVGQGVPVHQVEVPAIPTK